MRWSKIVSAGAGASGARTRPAVLVVVVLEVVVARICGVGDNRDPAGAVIELEHREQLESLHRVNSHRQHDQIGLLALDDRVGMLASISKHGIVPATVERRLEQFERLRVAVHDNNLPQGLDGRAARLWSARMMTVSIGPISVQDRATRFSARLVRFPWKIRQII